MRLLFQLFWSAAINGVLAPPLIVLVVLLSSDRAVMGKHVSSPLTLAAVGMFLTMQSN